MKTYNQFLETPFSEEVKPPEPPQDEGEDKNTKSKEKRQKQIKKMVLLKKLQAVRAGAGADIVASHTPEGEMVEAKVDTGTPEEKEKARNIRKFGVSHNVAGHGKLRRALHRSNRGDKKKKGDKSQYVEMEASMPNVASKDRKVINSRAKGLFKKDLKGTVQGVNEEDKAYAYVVAKLKKQHGDGVLTKGDKIKPPSAAQKKANAAHRAKVDKENAAEFKKDPSQGRYPKGYSNRGSD